MRFANFKDRIQLKITSAFHYVKKHSSKSRSVLFIAGFAVIGVIALSLSHAATPSVSIEGEGGELSNGAQSIEDPSASSGSYATFSASYKPFGMLVSSDALNSTSGSPDNAMQKYVCQISQTTDTTTCPVDGSKKNALSYFHVNMCDVQPTASAEYDWKKVNGQVDPIIARGFEPAFRVRIDACWVSYDTGSDAVSSCKDRDRAPALSRAIDPSRVQTWHPSRQPCNTATWNAYKSFLTALVNQYCPRDGVCRVREYAIENEVHSNSWWWRPEVGDPDYDADLKDRVDDVVNNYKTVVRNASETLHNTNPNVVVLDGGMASRTYSQYLAMQSLDSCTTDDCKVNAIKQYNGMSKHVFGTLRGPIEPILCYTSTTLADRTDCNTSNVNIATTNTEERVRDPQRYGRSGWEQLRNYNDKTRGDFAYIYKLFPSTFELSRPGDATKRDNYDVYQIHYYDNYAYIPDVTNFIKSNIGSSFPMEAWETGAMWPDCQNTLDNAKFPYCNSHLFSEIAHGQDTVKFYANMLRSGIRRSTYVPIRYAGSEGNNELIRGLFTPCADIVEGVPSTVKQRCAAADANLRPAGKGFRSLASVANSSGAKSYISINESDLRGILFLNSDNTANTILWNDKTTSNLKRSITGEPAISFFNTINESAITSSPVAVSQTPILIKGIRASNTTEAKAKLLSLLQ